MLPGGGVVVGGGQGGTSSGGYSFVIKNDPTTPVGSASAGAASGSAGTEWLTSSMLAPVTATITAVTGLISAYETYQAGEEAKDIAEANAALIRMETEEQARVLAEENARLEAKARARAAASGLSGASTELYLSALAESGRQDIDWLRQVGASKESAAMSEGRAAYHQARAAMWGGIGSTVASTASVYRMFSA